MTLIVRSNDPCEHAREVIFAPALPIQYAKEVGGSDVFIATAMHLPPRSARCRSPVFTMRPTPARVLHSTHLPD